jgi:hypothetical protein
MAGIIQEKLFPWIKPSLDPNGLYKFETGQKLVQGAYTFDSVP